MIARSGHILFPPKVKYRDLAPVFPEILRIFLEEANQVPEEREITSMVLRRNMTDLLRNRKPEGYNRGNRLRLIFPVNGGGVGFYIYRSSRSEEVVKVIESISRLLKMKRIPHKVEWDRMVLYRIKEARSRRVEVGGP